ncbi:MAG: Crp/Fnr family transcriptional regulator [Ktedonobacteraceae bacterium]|nr:Crp/Fnr family transcriptional regulator [Chloroflexota bacterium]
MPIEVEMLRQIPIFAPLAQADLEQVARVTVERQFDRGDIIFLEGRPNGALHYLCSGLVKVFKTSLDGREQVLRLIGAGNTFNEVPALDGGPNPASAAAMEACTIYVIQRTELRKLIVERPAVAEAVVQVLASALRHLVTLVEDLSFRHVTARVARLLLDQEAATMPAGASARRLTQQEMGAIVGTAREVVGRALKELEVAGAIEMRQGHAVVVDRERLGGLAQG